MVSQRKAGAILGYANIIVKNLVNLVYTPMLLAFVGQADYGVYQTANSFVFSLTLLTLVSPRRISASIRRRRLRGRRKTSDHSMACTLRYMR